jgi:hypothetical protein
LKNFHRILMKKLLLWMLLIAPLTQAYGQKITAEKTYSVNYPTAEIGYPSRIVANKEDKFSFIEYWVNGDQHKYTNYYLQTYDQKFEEVWFRAVTHDNDPKLATLVDVVRLDKAVGVVGTQYSPAIKRMATKMQLWDLEGMPKGTMATISTFSKKAKKGYEEVLHYSPDQKLIFWLGHNPKASYKKRSFFCSVFDEGGNKLWGKQIFLEPAAKKYFVKQAAVDNRGNAYFYMVYETMTNTVKDTVNQPMIVRYNFKENKSSTYAIKFPGVSVPEGMIKVTAAGELAFVGILSDGGERGFLNGANAYQTALKWNKMVFLNFDIGHELTKKQEQILDLPESWITRYKDRGADFTKSEILEEKNQLYWVMEEFYVADHNGKPQHRYYDVATVAIDVKNGAIKWASNFEKKQRDYYSGQMLSYCSGISNGQLHCVYLNERGAQGKIVCSSFDLKSGEVTTVDLAKNEREDYLFFPRRSTMIGPDKMMLLGVGFTDRNNYKLIEVSFD